MSMQKQKIDTLMEIVLIGNLFNIKNKKHMCFQKSKQSKVLRAKRDIVVYKVGIKASKTVFIPYFISNFSYETGTKNITETNFNISNIDKGFHSYINIITRSFYNRIIPHLNVYKNTKRNTLINRYTSVSR